MLVAGVFPSFLWNSSHTFPEIILQLHGYILCWTALQCCVVRLWITLWTTLWLRGGSSTILILGELCLLKKSVLTVLQCIVHRPDWSGCQWERVFTETHFIIYVGFLGVSFGIYLSTDSLQAVRLFYRINCNAYIYTIFINCEDKHSYKYKW